MKVCVYEEPGGKASCLVRNIFVLSRLVSSCLILFSWMMMAQRMISSISIFHPVLFFTDISTITCINGCCRPIHDTNTCRTWVMSLFHYFFFCVLKTWCLSLIFLCVIAKRTVSSAFGVIEFLIFYISCWSQKLNLIRSVYLYKSILFQGDSGGSLVCESDGESVLVGLTSYGTDDCGTASVYTRIASYRQWLTDHGVL